MLLETLLLYLPLLFQVGFFWTWLMPLLHPHVCVYPFDALLSHPRLPFLMVLDYSLHEACLVSYCCWSVMVFELLTGAKKLFQRLVPRSCPLHINYQALYEHTGAIKRWLSCAGGHGHDICVAVSIGHSN